MLHDAGKLRAAFQAYIRKENTGAEHSICGAVLAIDRYGPSLGKLLAYAIAGHHGGMPDGDTLMDRLALAKQDHLLADMHPWPTSLVLPELSALKLRGGSRKDKAFELHFLVRMLYSALVDADFLETERFYTLGKAEIRDGVAAITLGALAERLDRHLSTLGGGKTAPEVLARRAEVLRGCRDGAEQNPGVFSLTVPTGGGKTLSSLAFALRHAEKHGLQRVIYVIPYTSIIEQTAQVFRTAFDDLAEAVIEHHSAAKVRENKDTEGLDQVAVVAAENWDAPVIVTTSVQFFESLYSNKPSRCRKLHNIANAVVVLDEVQALPLPFLRPCIAALRELSEGYRTSVVLCSATMPDWGRGTVFREGFNSKPKELAPDVTGLFTDLARVRCEQVGLLEDEALADELADAPQVLCIVDSRPQAAAIHDLVKAARPAGTFHLSAAMCPTHRRQVLDQVKYLLENEEKCRLIATTVIEAGVDVDFPEVWRAAAGIDSLIQAAGRCNRNGGMAPELGRFVVFDSARELKLADVKQRRQYAEELLKNAADPLDLATVRAWFERLYTLKQEELDGKGILGMIEERASKLNWPFRTIAEEFRLIDQATEIVIVPFNDEARALIESVRIPGPPVFLETRRKLQQYSVSVYPNQFKALMAAGAISQIGTDGQFNELIKPQFYDQGVGMTLGKDMRSVEDNIM